MNRNSKYINPYTYNTIPFFLISYFKIIIFLSSILYIKSSLARQRLLFSTLDIEIPVIRLYRNYASSGKLYRVADRSKKYIKYIYSTRSCNLPSLDTSQYK